MHFEEVKGVVVESLQKVKNGEFYVSWKIRLQCGL